MFHVRERERVHRRETRDSADSREASFEKCEYNIAHLNRDKGEIRSLARSHGARACKIFLLVRRYRACISHAGFTSRGGTTNSPGERRLSAVLSKEQTSLIIAHGYTLVAVGQALSKAGREVPIGSSFIAGFDTPDKHSRMRSLIARGNLHRRYSRARRSEAKERRTRGGWCRRGWEGSVGEGDSLVVQHGSVWTTRDPRRVPPRVRVRALARMRAHAPSAESLFLSLSSSWPKTGSLRGPYYARRGPPWTVPSRVEFRSRILRSRLKRRNILR